MQTTSDILMIRPVNFGFNDQTASSNTFQIRSAEQDIQKRALKEFDNFVILLRQHGVNVIVVDDNPIPHTPDSIFPNNWISFHNNGEIFLYPMYAENRRKERRTDLIELLENQFLVKKVTDLSYFEKDNKFLEGTGSAVLDRDNKIAYACLSPRTDPEALNVFSTISGYETITFRANIKGVAIYHTNVMMSVGAGFAVVCADSIYSETEKQNLLNKLVSTHKEIIPISIDQMNHFAGNMLQIKNKLGKELLIMSSAAYHSLLPDQVEKLQKYGQILHAPLPTIELAGGGSARCMMAEIHLPHNK